MKQEMKEWQWHWLEHLQFICTSLQTENNGSFSSLNFYRSDALLTPNQRCQFTERNFVLTKISFLQDCL